MLEFKPIRELMGPFGHWEANSRVFFTKKEALEYASTLPYCEVIWRWYNNIYKNVDVTKLGNISLTELYRIRAQQLRDSYNWLTLHYSGGADSHNILMTFLNNNIPLDHVYVNWPMKTINNKKVYTPNIQDKSASNILSEWEYAIAPTLGMLKRKYPEIEIEIGDWSENMTETYYTDDRFHNSTTYWGAGSLFRNQNESLTVKKKLDKGLNVAEIFGFDKPHLFLHNDKVTVSMFFHDSAFQTATNASGVFEPFYWSPRLPELAFEMAYVNFQYFNANPRERRYIRQIPMRVGKELTNEYHNDLCRKICYPDTWDVNKFQSSKPRQGARTDRDFWIYGLNDFSRLVSAWKYKYSGYLENINQRYYDERGGLLPIRSTFHIVGKFDVPHYGI